MRLPFPALVILVGPSGAGKSTWAAANFRPEQVVSSDAIRALVGEGQHDQRAGTDAFDVLDLVLERRLRRGLLTVVDTLGLDPSRRSRYRQLAERHGIDCHVVLFDTPAALCRARNKLRSRPTPAKVLAAQLSMFAEAAASIDQEGFGGVHAAAAVEVVPSQLLGAPDAAARQEERPMSMRFGLQIPSFAWEGGPAATAAQLGAIGVAAERAGFSSLWLMDHFLQIPQVGPEWQDMLDSYTTLGFLAGQTSTIRLGTLVTGVAYRNVAHLAKIVATLDVLSGGRAVCGIGTGWFEREHRVYGWTFPPVSVRYQLLEDALELLPLMWGRGAPAYDGRTITVPEAICYPRPLQSHVPILVGGSGERRTLRLVARYADACNLFGDAATIGRKLEILDGHCQAEGRSRSAIRVTHLSSALVGASRIDLDATVARLRPSRVSPEAFSARVNAGTVEDHIGRLRELAEAGVQTAIVNLADVSVAAVECFGEVIKAFPSDGDGF